MHINNCIYIFLSNSICDHTQDIVSVCFCFEENQKIASMTLMTETQMLMMRMREERRFCSQESDTLDRNHILPHHQSGLLPCTTYRAHGLFQDVSLLHLNQCGATL